MSSRLLAGREAIRRGFTIVELLIAMALIVLIMAILSQAFVEGLESFRHLKGIGDLQEDLRQASIGLRRDVLATNQAANDFIIESLRTGSADRAQADALRARYEAIGADAADLDAGLREVGRQTTNPRARRLLARTLEALAGVKLGAATMVRILSLVNPPPTPVPDA
jgi:prepilin-type N-terminal cleavage/methylation domain-containing protein